MVMGCNVKRILQVLGRKKIIDESFESPLRRCLVFWDLFLLGVGGSVDVALYVVLGNVIRDIAGPAVIISMIFGFLVCFGSGLCYAEFASYIPSSGSDYDYVYTSLGELCGFFDGWSILVASVTATAALAQGAADLLSSLTDSTTFENLDAHVVLPNHVLFAPNLNMVAILIVTLITVLNAVGVHSSIKFNDCIVIINLLVVVFTVILGLFYINFDHWSSWEKFAPYGVSGILKSLPFTVFFYGGFISVTFSTEEVINPCSNLPRSIVASLIGIFVSFLAVGVVLSLVMPYNQLPKGSPMSDAFGIVSFKASKYIIATGGFCSCFSSVLTACYANSRLSYVMSRDGLLLNILGKVHKRTLVPVHAVIATGLIAAVLAAFVNLSILVEICSILALLPYLLLCYTVITMRYKKGNALVILNIPIVETDKQLDQTVTDSVAELSSNVCPESGIKVRIKVALAVLVASASGLSLAVRYSLSSDIPVHNIVFVSLMVIFLMPLVISVLVIYRTPYEKLQFPFMMPFFPILPAICLAMTTFIMLQFSMWAWILFSGNTIFGLIVYFSYGIHHSQVQKKCALTEQEMENIPS